MKLYISRLKVYAYHGVLPQEQTVGANFYLTIEAEVDADDTALRGDDLSGTVSYAEVIASATAGAICTPVMPSERGSRRSAGRKKSAQRWETARRSTPMNS